MEFTRNKVKHFLAINRNDIITFLPFKSQLSVLQLDTNFVSAIVSPPFIVVLFLT